VKGQSPFASLFDDDAEHSNPTSSDSRVVLADIKRFRPLGTREDCAGYSLPAYLHQALLMIVAQLAPWRTDANRVAVWSFSRGLIRLRALRDVQAICEANADLLRLGSDTTYLRWPYQLAPRGQRSVRPSLRRLDPADIGVCRDLAEAMGLEISTLAALAMMTVTVDLPLKGDVPRVIQTELRAWLRALHDRAALVTELRNRAVAAPPLSPTSATWADLTRHRSEEP
jgi:hypothetical protein